MNENKKYYKVCFFLVLYMFQIGILIDVFSVKNNNIKNYKTEVEELNYDLYSYKIKQEEYIYQLHNIVDNIYTNKFIGGGFSNELKEYENVDQLYEIIMTNTQDFDLLLVDVNEFIRSRKKLLTEIPSILPIQYDKYTRITSVYGNRPSPFNGKIQYHPGLDIVGTYNTPIVATANGKVLTVRNNHPIYGIMIILQHSNSIETLYAHLRKYVIKKGQIVVQGQIIGYMGNTGMSKGRHLHYEVHRDGKLMNPIDFIGNFELNYYMDGEDE